MVKVLSLIGIACIGIVIGKLCTKIKLPAILGWLITGMIFGPCLVDLVKQATIDSYAYKMFIKLAETFAGVMIGSEIVFKKIAKSGPKIIIVTVFQSIGTFILVTLAFIVACKVADLPIYLAFIFGGIALATAPAPAISIVNQYKAKGPVTDTLLPLAAIDDVIGIVVFFTVISVVSGITGGENVKAYMVVLMIALPFIIGVLVGLLGGYLIKKIKSNKANFLIYVILLVLNYGLGFICDRFIFHSFSINYLLIGMAFSMTVSNIVPSEKIEGILTKYKPILNLSILMVIINLGMPLDYRYIASAGVFTLVYIVARAVGKIGFSYLGCVVSKEEPTVRKYLGFTLLPHSGVSLVFTGIAVSTLATTQYGPVIQGTIAAAAIINEIIAIIMAKLSLQWAGEIAI